MKISIVIPCFNEQNTIELIIEKIKNQTKFDKEIIIIDDFSTDGTREILEKNLNNSVDKNSTMKMIAFKHFNNDMSLLDKYLEDNNYYINSDAYRGNLINPKSQLEFTF